MGERTRNDLKPLMFSGGDEMEINDYDRVSYKHFNFIRKLLF